MSVLEELDSLIERGAVSFVTVGLSTVKPGRRHASLCQIPLRFSQGYGDTCEAAIAEAIANITQRGGSPAPTAPKPIVNEELDEIDDLGDLLG